MRFGTVSYSVGMSVSRSVVKYLAVFGVLFSVSFPVATLAKEIKKFSESPQQQTDPAMAKIAEIGRQIARLQKQIVDFNQASFDAGQRAQKLFLKAAELRQSGIGRMVKQAELELEASRMDGEAMDLDRKINQSNTKPLLKVRAEMAQKASALRLKSAELRAQMGALAVESSEAQNKMDKLYSEANRENIAAAKHRVSVTDAEYKIFLLEQQMSDIASQPKGVN